MSNFPVIESIHARQILDSRGNPTIETGIILSNGITAYACVPSGASTGIREALELRDKGKIFGGKSVLKAVDNVNTKILPLLKGRNPFKQMEIDEIMIKADGTENKSRFGANAILGVSLATARVCAKFLNIPLYEYLGGINACILPVPMMNILNGGVHADNNIDFQEFMIAPTGAKNFEEALRMGAEVFYSLKSVLNKMGLATSVGDEGGFAPNLRSNSEGIEVILKAIELTGLNTKQIKICLDAASSEFYKDGLYHIENKKLTNEEIADFFERWMKAYPIISIEDGMAQDDWEGWKILTQRIGDLCQLVGDDLFVTNPKILKEGIKKNIANAILIKLNQIGTLSETMDAIRIAQKSSYSAIVSHRSGETEDTFIADLAVATNCGQIKTGSLSRTDRIVKYNRLLKIEEYLGINAKYLGINAFKEAYKQL